MTAEEMFEKLGYKRPYYEKDHTIHYTKLLYESEDGYYEKINSITFWKRNKIITIDGNFNTGDLQAIKKQVEELGWNNETTI